MHPLEEGEDVLAVQVEMNHFKWKHVFVLVFGS